MISLAAAAVAFVGIHLLISGTALRGRLVAILGEGPYRGLFSLASLAAVVWLAISLPRAEETVTYLWNLGAAGRWIALLLMLIASIMVVAGLTTPNPTSVGQEKILESGGGVRGILRVTRHPFLMGVALWAIAHLLANGRLAPLIFFGSFLILSLMGPSSIDAKRRAADPAGWRRFAAATSIAPFGAILAGRNRFVFSELLNWRLGAALIVFVVLIALHPLIFSAPALPS